MIKTELNFYKMTLATVENEQRWEKSEIRETNWTRAVSGYQKVVAWTWVVVVEMVGSDQM